MQKISSYLYPNKINIVADVAVFPTRWNIVYQNRVKIYQGVDNVLTIDVKNADQKRIDISEMSLEMSITDVKGQALATLPLTPTATTGLATVNVTPDILENLTPQFLQFTIYRLNDDDTKTLMYADAQFGAKGNMELVGSAVPVNPAPRYITRFNAITNDRITPFSTTYYSDAVEITKPNFLVPAPNEALSFDFDTTLLQAEVTIEFTKDSVVSAGTEWETIETFTIPLNSSLNNRVYFYPTVKREYTWARVKYTKQSTNGKFNKVTVTFETLDEAFIASGNAGNNFDLTVDGGWSTT
jgi:hypothetical protein